MKTFNAFIISFIFLFILSSKTTQAQVEHNVSMGAGYANEVFFSLKNGVVKTSPRNTWDIAFYTPAFSAGIITNSGAGVELYTYPKAANGGWDSFDTTGKASWTPLYNDVSQWEEGAFNRNALGHPDYGWGIYNMSSHSVFGDSLFLIKSVDGQYRKLNIIKKISTANTYIIRFSNLDGSNDHTDTLDVNPYTGRMFMSYSFATGIVDREPLLVDWDLLFTRYHALVQNTPYPVVGVLSNPKNKIAQVEHVAPDFVEFAGLAFSKDADVIGHDWKTINMATMHWDITDSLAYFIKAQDSAVYKIVFEAFSGSATGTATFTQQLLKPSSINFAKIDGVKVYPNPANDLLKIELSSYLNGANLTLTDLSGRILIQQTLGNSLVHELSLTGLAKGVYLMQITDQQKMFTSKVVVR